MYIKIIILAIALLIFYRTLSFLNKRLHISPGIRYYFTVVLPIAELLTWLGFTVWCIRLMYESGLYVILIALSAILILLFIPSWFLIRDLIYGIVLVFQRKIELNTRIKIGEMAGKVVKIGYFTFDVKSNDGSIETIPYSKIQSKVISKSGENINLEKQLIVLTIPAQDDIDESLERLRMTLLNSPWVAASHEPIVKKVVRENDMLIIEVFVYLLKKEYVEKVRGYIDTTY